MDQNDEMNRSRSLNFRNFAWISLHIAAFLMRCLKWDGFRFLVQVVARKRRFLHAMVLGRFDRKFEKGFQVNKLNKSQGIDKEDLWIEAQLFRIAQCESAVLSIVESMLVIVDDVVDEIEIKFVLEAEIVIE